MRAKRLSWAVTGLVAIGTLSTWGCHRSAVHEVVSRVEAGTDWVIWDLNPAIGRERCEIHGDLLVTAVVPMRWGYAPPEIFDREFLGAIGEQFPYATEADEGGCIPLGYTHARVKRCSKCIEAKKRWLSHHPNVDESGRRLTRR